VTSAKTSSVANNVERLKKAIETLSSSKDIRYLYLAMHGNEGSIVPYDHEALSAVVLRNVLAKAKVERTSLRGLCFGCCDFGTLKTASKLFDKDMRRMARRVSRCHVVLVFLHCNETGQ
jgi:hypothetical protein